MELGLLVRDTRMFGPVFQVRRTLRCTLGRPEIEIEDEVANHGDTPVPHHWLYHCNLGYPLLDEGGRFIYRGAAESGRRRRRRGGILCSHCRPQR